jgi:osmotically-inducible protein OsmY
MKLRTLIGALLAMTLLQACVPLIVGGVAGGVVTAIDRRTYGEQYRDTEIERTFNHNFSPALESKTAVSANVFNRWMLLTGQAINEQAKSEVEALARSVPNVREVYNEITIGYPASFTTRANDRLIVSNLKARLLDAKEVSTIHVNVICEGNIVYLMGMLTDAEAQAAITIARGAQGVQKVVSLIEIITPEVARQRTLQTEPVKAKD